MLRDRRYLLLLLIAAVSLYSFFMGTVTLQESEPPQALARPVTRIPVVAPADPLVHRLQQVEKNVSLIQPRLESEKDLAKMIGTNSILQKYTKKSHVDLPGEKAWWKWWNSKGKKIYFEQILHEVEGRDWEML
eukprot:Rmarinus@m.13858